MNNNSPADLIRVTINDHHPKKFMSIVSAFVAQSGHPLHSAPPPQPTAILSTLTYLTYRLCFPPKFKSFLVLYSVVLLHSFFFPPALPHFSGRERN